MPQIRPISELRKTNEISALCHEKKEPVFITKNGFGDMVIMSMETYEAMTETLSIDRAISEAEEELMRDGKTYDAETFLKSLRRKYFGTV